MRILLLVAFLSPTLASAATFKVGPNCQYTTIQAAIDAASFHSDGNIDVVRLVKNADPRPQALTIDNQNLTIIGGADFCDDGSDPDIGEKTFISGAGGAAAPVITITGNGIVTLSNLAIVGGDPATDGGGIAYSASGVDSPSELHLFETTIELNNAANGAGIHFYSPGPRVAELHFGEDVGIFRNVATARGGGVKLVGRVWMRTGKERFFFHGNKAREGGGLSVVRPARADLGTAQWEDQYTFKANEADSGGAIHVSGGNVVPGSAEVTLYSIDPLRPMQLVDNVARREGAAVTLVSESDVPADTARVCTRRVNFIGNRLNLQAGATASYGGAVALIRGAAKFGECSDADFPAGAITSCPPGVCGIFRGNFTRAGAAETGAEKIFRVALGGNVELRNAVIEQNEAFYIFDVQSAQESARRSRVALTNVLVANNRFVGDLPVGFFVGVSAQLIARHATVSMPAGVETAIYAPAVNPPPVIEIRSSIFQLPSGARGLDAPAGDRSNWMLDDVMINRMPLSFETMPGLIAADPRLAVDYSLREGSPAIDVSVGQGDVNYDLYGQPRVDRCSIGNGPGIIDLGAIESQGSPDVIFGGGFEAGVFGCR